MDDRRVLACIVAGCDYYSRPGVGPKTATRLVDSKYNSNASLWDNAAAVGADVLKALVCFLCQPIAHDTHHMELRKIPDSHRSVAEEVWGEFRSALRAPNGCYERLGDKDCVHKLRRLRERYCLWVKAFPKGSSVPPAAAIPSFEQLLDFCSTDTATLTRQPGTWHHARAHAHTPNCHTLTRAH